MSYGQEWNPHRERHRKPSADQMDQMTGDGHFEDDPPEDRPAWYQRLRASKSSEAARKAVEDRRHQDGRCERDCPHCGPECRECGGADWIHEKSCSRGGE